MKNVTVITGASRGIGAATARLCAKAGHAVAINYLKNSDMAAAVAASITNAGGEAIIVQANTCVEADVELMF